MREKSLSCHACGAVWTVEPPISRREECPGCHRDARVCLNCQFFDSGSYRSCREEQAGFVKEKDRANYCSYFEAFSGPRGSRGLEVARGKLESLFGQPEKKSDEPLSNKPDKQSDDIKAQLEKWLKSKT